MADLLRQYIYLRTYRGEVVVKSMVQARSLLQEIAKRFDLSLEDLVQFIPEEIINLIETSEMPNYEERKSGYKLLILDGEPQLIGDIEISEEKYGEISELEGKGVVEGIIKGEVKILKEKEDVEKFEENDVLVTQMTSPDMMPAISKASAIVTDEGGMTSHAVLISRELNIPCVIGTENATKVLEDSDEVKVNAENDIVRVIN